MSPALHHRACVKTPLLSVITQLAYQKTQLACHKTQQASVITQLGHMRTPLSLVHLAQLNRVGLVVQATGHKKRYPEGFNLRGICVSNDF